MYDSVIVGGGPAGLSAALTLGRARKRLLLCDSGPRRNAAALHLQNFVTRDGIGPDEFRRIAREQLARYPNVHAVEEGVEEIRGQRGAFDVRLPSGTVVARRVLLATGMIDELPATAGLRELWGTAVLICPYCHGWEVQDRRFAYLAGSAEALDFALMLRGWSADVMVLTNGLFAPDSAQVARLASAGVGIDDRPITRLVSDDQVSLARIEFATGGTLERDVLFLHPRQRQTDVVRSLDLALDEKGYLQLDAVTRETSVPGIYGAGDLATQAQSAVLAAAAGSFAAGMLNHSLALELATPGSHGN